MGNIVRFTVYVNVYCPFPKYVLSVPIHVRIQCMYVKYHCPFHTTRLGYSLFHYTHSHTHARTHTHTYTQTHTVLFIAVLRI
jgi:hypothetical protein